MQIQEIFAVQKRQAIETLVKLGAAHYVKDMNLYHGRSGDGSDWEVIPNFNNADNATNNFNIYSVNGLYVGEEDIAERFAQARSRQTNGTAEVHKIVGVDDDAIVIDFLFNTSTLTEKQKSSYLGAMRVLTSFTLSEINPIKFEYREAIDIIINQIIKYQKKCKITVISSNIADSILGDLENDKEIQLHFKNKADLREFVYNLIGSYNARSLLRTNPVFVLNKYTSGNRTYRYQNNPDDYPINHNFISAWCASNKIVGIKENVISATLNDEIPICQLFDTKKVMSEKQHGVMLAKMLDRYGEIAQSLEHISDKELSNFLEQANAQEIMAYISQNKKCQQLYNMSCYIWEGWSIGQHTTAVIDFFDRFYTEQVPEKLRPFIKICMLAHDIGKSFAVQEGVPQKQMNTKYSKFVFEALQVPEEYRSLINFIIGDSQTFTSKIALGVGDKKAHSSALKDACKIAFVEAFGREPTQKELTGLRRICVILQECDSGAYTRYAQIKEGKKTVGGGNDRFTASFELDSRGYPRLKNIDEELLQ